MCLSVRLSVCLSIYLLNYLSKGSRTNKIVADVFVTFFVSACCKKLEKHFGGILSCFFHQKALFFSNNKFDWEHFIVCVLFVIYIPLGNVNDKITKGCENPDNPEKNHWNKDESQQQTQPTYDAGPESNPGHIGGRRGYMH